MKSILRLVACGICESLQEPKPYVPILSMSSNEVSTELLDLGVKSMHPCLLDAGQDYYYTTDEGWAEVFNYVYCTFKMPKYIAARMDCEDFGILLKGLVSALFGFNYFALTIGDIPKGRHGFNFFRDQNGHMVIEPQTANYFVWGDRYYEPEDYLL